jgi:predicted phosphate transport protein (TIGR00153 family)
LIVTHSDDTVKHPVRPATRPYHREQLAEALPMLLDRIVRLLLPRQGQFFTLLEGLAGQIEAAAAVFGELDGAASHAQIDGIAGRLKEIEKAADEVDRQLHRELDRTFVTPIDREDLAALAKALDDVVDGMEHSATFASLYQFDRLTDAMREQVRLTGQAARELGGAVRLLRRLGDPEAGHAIALKIHTLESEADSVYRRAVAALFIDHLSPSDLVRQKDMLFALEGGMDVCEDAMDVIRSVVVKNG